MPLKRGAGWLLLCLALAACGPLDRRADPPSGTLRGRVRLAEGAALPAYAPFDLARRSLHEGSSAAPPAECAQANERARRPVAATPERLLASVIVAASDFTRFVPRGPKTHVVAIRGCTLEPPTVAALAGDRLVLENHDAFAFEPLFGPTLTPRALSPGARATFTLGAGVESVLCNRTAPCGRTDVVTFQHPVYAVTATDGTFQIDAFPADELVRVTAWHPLFEEAETFVWIERGKTQEIELVLVPKARFLAPDMAQGPAL